MQPPSYQRLLTNKSNNTMKLKINFLASDEVTPIEPQFFPFPSEVITDYNLNGDIMTVDHTNLPLLIADLTVKLNEVINTTPRELIIDEDSAQGDGVYSLYMAIKQAALLIEMNNGIPSDHLTLAADQLIESIPELFSERSHRDPTPLTKEINPTLFF